MRSLFDDTKNPLFRLMCQIVNEIGNGAHFTRKQIFDRISTLPEFIYLEAPEIDREKEIVDALFKFNDAGFAEIPSDKKFSLPMSDTELFWLSAILSDEEFFFLLPDELRQKLTARLKDLPPLYEKNFRQKLRATHKQSSGKIFSEKLTVIVNALRQGKKIFCDGEILTPCRLEYDLFTDKFFLITWLDDEHRAEKIPVETLGAVSLSEEIIPNDCDKLLKKFYQDNVAEVSLKVWNTRNAVERCFALFSSFDKKARLQDDGTYFLTVTYCLLDESEIIEKIFSLGSAVTVIAPQSFRDRIIEKFVAIQNIYK